MRVVNKDWYNKIIQTSIDLNTLTFLCVCCAAYSTPTTSPAQRFVSVGPRDPGFNIPQQPQVTQILYMLSYFSWVSICIKTQNKAAITISGEFVHGYLTDFKLHNLCYIWSLHYISTLYWWHQIFSTVVVKRVCSLWWQTLEQVMRVNSCTCLSFWFGLDYLAVARFCKNCCSSLNSTSP